MKSMVDCLRGDHSEERLVQEWFLLPMDDTESKMGN